VRWCYFKVEIGVDDDGWFCERGLDGVPSLHMAGAQGGADCMEKNRKAKDKLKNPTPKNAATATRGLFFLVVFVLLWPPFLPPFSVVSSCWRLWSVPLLIQSATLIDLSPNAQRPVSLSPKCKGENKNGGREGWIYRLVSKLGVFISHIAPPKKIDAKLHKPGLE
jgi:hypothetical protein